jgi:hypothetical protein
MLVTEVRNRLHLQNNRIENYKISIEFMWKDGVFVFYLITNFSREWNVILFELIL